MQQVLCKPVGLGKVEIDIESGGGGGGGGSSYVLPTASTDTLGGVKIDGTSIVINDGVISVGYQNGDTVEY